MLRVLSAVVLLAMLGACATDAPPDSGQLCGQGEGPFDGVIEGDRFDATNLTCEHVATRWFCGGTCCHAKPISQTTTPIECTSVCTDLDEASCTADTRCYVARDQDAFIAGAASFIGCYKAVGLSHPVDCAMRDADYCAYDGMCAGLYSQTPTSATFVSCIAKTSTMP